MFYEQYVFTIYMKILQFIQGKLNARATLEEDLELLKRGEPGSDLPPISFEMRMAVVYRAEKKKILRSQINLIDKILQILQNVEAVLLNPEETDVSQIF